ncbi:MAG: hypothetical protein C4518_03595 [Desulfobacteraceae bacterium]|nr:MAG: hypothetical protein C4518_03595 [Desulfobacteraceae bacterium]
MIQAPDNPSDKKENNNNYRKIIRTRHGAFMLDESGIAGSDWRGLQIRIKWKEIVSIKWRSWDLALRGPFGNTLVMKNVLTDLTAINAVAWYASKFGAFKSVKSSFRQSLDPAIAIMGFIGIAVLAAVFFIFVTQVQGNEIWGIILVICALFIPAGLFLFLHWVHTAIIYDQYLLLIGPLKKHRIAFKDILNLRITVKRFRRSESPDILIQLANDRSVLALPPGLDILEVYSAYVRAWDRAGTAVYPKHQEGQAIVPKSYTRFILFLAVWPLLMILGLYIKDAPHRIVEKGTVVVAAMYREGQCKIYEPGERGPFGREHYEIQTDGLKVSCEEDVYINKKPYRLTYTIDYKVADPRVAVRNYGMKNFRRDSENGITGLCANCAQEATRLAEAQLVLTDKVPRNFRERPFQKSLAEMDREIRGMELKFRSISTGLEIERISVDQIQPK